MKRIESDSLGEVTVPETSLYGCHTERALKHFGTAFHPNYIEFYKAYAEVKLAAALTNTELGYLKSEIAEPLIQALKEMTTGQWFDYFCLNPFQGGAGTSANMNINEIAANRAGQIRGQALGTYSVDPLEHVNLHQSTNDTYITAFRVALYRLLQDTENQLNQLLQVCQEKEQSFANIIKIGRTEMMPAVPTTLGKTFSAFSDVIGRDRWRIFKAQERIRQINLGGTAIGTGVAAPRDYIFRVSRVLREMTGLPVSRAENLIDATQNLDTIAEAMSMVKVSALNLEKIARDLRLMQTLGEICLPDLQVGSSIMPGKINPVIPEFVITLAKRIKGNDLILSEAVADGQLELNALSPLICYLSLESCMLLNQGATALGKQCISQITANPEICRKTVLSFPGTTALLIPKIGYHEASKVAKYMLENNIDIYQAGTALKLISQEELTALLLPENILSLGFEA